MKQKRKRMFLVLTGFCFSVFLNLPLFPVASGASKLVCNEPVKDFGRVPVNENGRAVGRHVFEIFNPTDEDVIIERVEASCLCVESKMEDKLIPRGKSKKLRIAFGFRLGGIQRETYDILIMPKDKKIETLKLQVSGASVFAPIVTPREIEMDFLYVGSENTRQIKILLPDKNEVKNFIESCKMEWESPEIFLSEVKYESEKVKGGMDDAEGFFHKNRATLTLTIKPIDKDILSERKGKILIRLKTGELLKIPVHWKVMRREMFETSGKKFFLINLQPDEIRELQIIYNEDVGGKIKNVKSCNPDMTLVGIRRNRNSMHIKLKFRSGKKITDDAKVAELVVETENGNKHKLPIISS
ncbi:MAG: DUF1573 domain-containing protein [Puniceicoccales bacterium]|jgi:hypothetical protein|nr:DUF1573 domain-containing protein [Puniceicoccales bacterium]